MNSKIRIKFHDKDVRRYFEVHLVKKKQKKRQVFILCSIVLVPLSFIRFISVRS